MIGKWSRGGKYFLFASTYTNLPLLYQGVWSKPEIYFSFDMPKRAETCEATNTDV